MSYLAGLVILLSLSLICGKIGQRLGLPLVIGNILGGIIAGPSVLGLLHLNTQLKTASDLGVILLMFIAGLTCDFAMVKKYFKPAVVIAISGVVLPLIAFTICGKLFGVSTLEALFWGIVFAATSVSISVVVLQEFGQLRTKAGAAILGAAVVDDVLAIILLSLFESFFGKNANPNGFLVIILLQAAYFAFLFVSVKWMIPAFIRITGRHFNAVGVAALALIVCLLFAYLAEGCHLSSVLGAFFAGIAIAQTKAKPAAERGIGPLGDCFFIPIFFAVIGMEISFEDFLPLFWFVCVMTVLAVLTKWLGAGLGAFFTGFSLPEANVIGSAMISRGEMSLIVAQLGENAHLISQSLYSAIVLVIVLTTILSPLFLKSSIKLLNHPKS